MGYSFNFQAKDSLPEHPWLRDKPCLLKILIK